MSRASRACRPRLAVALVLLAAAVTLLALCAAFAPRPAHGADATPMLFPVPFTVEHQVVETEPGGEMFRTDAVTDTYGGTTLVSVRPGGSRIIVDFAKRTVTEVSVEKSTYWTLTFSQMGDLSRRLAKAEDRPSIPAPRSASSAAVGTAVRVEESSDPGREPPGASPGPSPRGRARHFRAWIEGGPAAEVWVNETVRLTPAALDALEAFEKDALGGGAQSLAPSALVAAARRAAGGAIPVRVRRPLSTSGGSVDDVVSSLTPLPAFPQKLLVIGDGFRRVPSPLEEMVAFAEDEASRDSSRLVK